MLGLLVAVAVVGQVIDYDVVTIKAPRYGDVQNTDWPEVFDPIEHEPGADLIVIHPDGTETVLDSGGSDGACLDPCPTYDGKYVYYSKLIGFQPNNRPANHYKVGRLATSADLYRVEVATGNITRLTNQESTPTAAHRNKPLFKHGVYNTGPCVLPDGRLMFTSSRNGFLPPKPNTFPCMQLFVMNVNSLPGMGVAGEPAPFDPSIVSNVEEVGFLNVGSALHPTILRDGRVMFSSYEPQGLRDSRQWCVWQMWPDGRNWGPLMSAFDLGCAFHYQTQLSDGRIIVVEYYNANNNGFGTLLAFQPSVGAGLHAFGSPNPNDPSNPKLQVGVDQNGKPIPYRYRFSPFGLDCLTRFATPRDMSSGKLNGQFVGKVTHPSGAPRNDLLCVWSPGPCNRDVSPVVNGGIYLLKGGNPISDPTELELIKTDVNYNYQQPRALVPYKDIYFMDAPTYIPWLPNDGSVSPLLPRGTPYGLVGTSTFSRRNSAPGIGIPAYGGLDSFNGNEHPAQQDNWFFQGSDAGKYSNSDIYSVRIVLQEPTSEAASDYSLNHANERQRVLGEVPLLKFDGNGNPILDSDGNPDTSFLAKIPADHPFTFQLLDKNGMVLTNSQTWHQLRPGEVRYDCGGCHAHALLPMDFNTTFASTPQYSVADLTQVPAKDVEWLRDIKPILRRTCLPCHSTIQHAGNLVLDDDTIQTPGGGNVEDNTYRRLADDQAAKYGYKPVNGNSWRNNNASRYISKFRSRRSLLVWKLYGARLDGWNNSDHPTESIPGDPTTLPTGADPKLADLDWSDTANHGSLLTEDEKRKVAAWIDLGCPLGPGHFVDETKPCLTISSPRGGETLDQPLDTIRIGMADAYSGLDMASFSVKADFQICGAAANSELSGLFAVENPGVWKLPITGQYHGSGTITAVVKDVAGNETKVVRSFVSP